MNRPLRIALISEHASPLAHAGGVDAGGQNVYVHHVARKLAARGHRVDVFTRRDDAARPHVSTLCPGARVVHVPAGPPAFVRKEELLQHMPEFGRRCEQVVRSGKPYDLAHANFFMSGMVARQLQKSLGLPFAITFHALGLVRLRHQKEADAFPPLRIDIERACVRDADAIVAECPQDVDDLRELYGAAPHKLCTVPCGFDPDEFRPIERRAARSALGIAQDEFVVLQLGRLVPRKGIDNVIMALSHMRSALPPGTKLRLIVVGGDAPEPDEALTPEIARLRQIAREAGVLEQVTFTGYRERAQLHRYYGAADVFVTTPWYEPFGITPLEAMACEVPVVASAVGGLRHTVVDGVTGLLVPAHAPEALARQLLLLRGDPDLAARLGRAGRARVQTHYTWDKVVDGLLAVYRSIVQVPAVQVSAARASRPRMARQEASWQ
jgi:glycosyltransferase involved in cell wall biosynthesis